MVIKPVSNFIFLEQVNAARSAAAWSQALERGLAGFKVTVVQGISDEAKGLLAHLKRDQGVHHSTDLFHLQHEVSKAMSLALRRTEQQAETEETTTQAHWQAECAAEQAYHRQYHGLERLPRASIVRSMPTFKPASRASAPSLENRAALRGFDMRPATSSLSGYDIF